MAATLAVAWLIWRPIPGSSETSAAALALLRTGTLADPFAGFTLPTGPTAHVSPLLAGLFAALFATIGEAAAQPILAALSILCLLAAAALMLAAAARLGLSAPARWALLAGLVFLPDWLWLAQRNMYRNDQPWGALLLMLALWAWIAHRPLLLALCAGLSALILPSLLPPITLALALALARRPRDAALAALIVAACIAPWAIRNQATLGAPILTRSNFALELTLGNRDGATGFLPVALTAELAPDHPAASPDAARRMAAIGEPAYMAAMREQALAWIAAHPAEFARLTLRRIWLTFFPDPAMLVWLPGPAWAHVALLWLFGAIRLLAIASALLHRRRDWLLLGFVVLPLLPYAVTHVTTRYLVVAVFPTILLAAIELHRRTQRAPPCP